jgi:hypothetical protein
MAEHVKVREDGSVEITYDSPEEHPCYGEAGKSISIRGWGPEEIQKIISRLHLDAEDNLPPGTVYDLRMKIDGSGVAWYHVDAMKHWPITGVIPYPGKANKLGGYIMLGTFQTPQKI